MKGDPLRSQNHYELKSSTFFNTFNLVFRYHLLSNIIFQLKLHSFLSKEEWSLVKRNVEKVLVWIESLDVSARSILIKKSNSTPLH